MPFIETARSLTEAVVAIEAEHMRSVTWCAIDEVKRRGWAVGGRCAPTDAVRHPRQARCHSLPNLLASAGPAPGRCHPRSRRPRMPASTPAVI